MFLLCVQFLAVFLFTCLHGCIQRMMLGFYSSIHCSVINVAVTFAISVHCFCLLMPLVIVSDATSASRSLSQATWSLCLVYY